MSKRDQLICKMPASCWGQWWRDGLPCGNGEIGLLLHGGVEEETILINHSRLWHWGKSSPVPDVHEALKQTRDLIDQGNFASANSITSQALLDKGYDSALFLPCPLADLKILLEDCAPFSDYSRILHMDCAEIVTEWKFQGVSFKRKCFASRGKDIFVFKQECTGKTASGVVSVGLHQSNGKDTARMEGECRDSLEIVSRDGCIFYTFRNDDGRDCGIVLRAASDGTIICGSDGSIIYRDVHEITLVGKVFVGADRKTVFSQAEAQLNSMDIHYEKLLDEHRRLHLKKYKSCDIRLADSGFSKSNEQMLLDAYENTPSNAMLEKLWRFGRYLFICATKEDGLPMPLYGLWHGEYDSIWSHNMANINIQMIYWHCFAGNLLSMNRAFIDYYYGLMDQFRENARQVFGMDGIYLSAGSTPGFGRINQLVPVITNWIAAGGWIASHFYKYYVYTGDREYLEKKILPFMIEAAKFYLDYLVITEEGILRCYPSVSPENTPGNLMPKEGVAAMSHGCPTCENALLDFAIIKELFRNLLTLSEEVTVEETILTKCREYLRAMPDYQYNEDGSVKEWIKEELQDNNFHRHISHLYPVFPGEEVDYDRDPHLAERFLKAVEKRELGGQTGWSFCHTACVLARLKQPEKAMEFMEILARSCLTGSFFTLHNDWRKMGMSLNLDRFSPVQLDANMGFTAVMQEMLFAVVEKTVKILPALPKRLKKGSAENLISPDGVFSFQWCPETVKIDILVKRKRSVTVQLPGCYEDYRVQCADSVVCHVEDGRVFIENRTECRDERIRIVGGRQKE